MLKRIMKEFIAIAVIILLFTTIAFGVLHKPEKEIVYMETYGYTKNEEGEWVK